MPTITCGSGMALGPVRCDVAVACSMCQLMLAQHLALVRDATRKHHVEGADAVAGHHDHAAIVQWYTSRTLPR